MVGAGVCEPYYKVISPANVLLLDMYTIFIYYSWMHAIKMNVNILFYRPVANVTVRVERFATQ